MQLNNLRRKNKEDKNWSSWAEEICGIKKADRLTPIFTLCVYHGLEKWDGPRSLKDMMDLGNDKDGISSLFNDYPMRLWCLNEIEDFRVFHTEIRQVFQAMKFRTDKKKLLKLVENDAAYQHMDADTLEVISVMLNVPRIWDKREEYMGTEGEREEYNMCQALKEMEEDARNEGMEAGMENGLAALVASLKPLLPNFQAVLETIKTNECYAQVTEEQVRKYY